MPRSDTRWRRDGRPSSKVSIVFSCTPVPARLISGTTAAPRTKRSASGTRPTNVTPGWRLDTRRGDAGNADTEICRQMRRHLFQEPVEADAVGLPGPGADQSRIALDFARGGAVGGFCLVTRGNIASDRDSTPSGARSSSAA